MMDSRDMHSDYVVILSCNVTIRMSCVFCCCCGGANGRGSQRLLLLIYGDFKTASQGTTVSELSDSLLAP